MRLTIDTPEAALARRALRVVLVQVALAEHRDRTALLAAIVTARTDADVLAVLHAGRWLIEPRAPRDRDATR